MTSCCFVGCFLFILFTIFFCVYLSSLMLRVLFIAQYVRYVSDMELNIKLQENKDGKIYTPYLKITYSFEEDAEIDANSTVKVV